MKRRKSNGLWAVLLLGGLCWPLGWGCGSEADDAPSAPEEPAEEAPTEPAAEPEHSEATFLEGRAEVSVEGARLQTDGVIFALFTSDPDTDGDRDALVASKNEDRVDILFSRREGSEFEPARSLADFELGEGCELARSAFHALQAGFVQARVWENCAGELANIHTWFLTTDHSPRLAGDVGVLAAEQRYPEHVSVTARADDANDDGHPDLLVNFAVTPTTGAGHANESVMNVEIAFLNHPSGFAPAVGALDSQLGPFVDAADTALGSGRDEAFALTNRAGDLFDALCQESPFRRIRLGASGGLPCSAALRARLNTLEVVAWSEHGDALRAAQAYDRLVQDPDALAGRLRSRAERALLLMPATSAAVVQGPAVTVSELPYLALPPVAFIDDNRIAVRSAPPRVFDIALGELRALNESENAALFSRLIQDPSDSFAVSRITESCEGEQLQIVPARSVRNPQAEPVSRPWITHFRSRSCPENEAGKASAWVPLGWAPQGIVASHYGALNLVPMNASGQADGLPRAIRSPEEVPLPLQRGAMASTGLAYVLALPQGIIRVAVSGQSESTLIRPDGWNLSNRPRQAAISRDGRRAAFVIDGHLRVATFPQIP